MNEKTGHFDENSDLKISPKFSEDLNILFKPELTIPPDVDKIVLDRAREQFTAKRRNRRILSHITIWRVAAAAAVIILAFSLVLTQKPGSTTSQSLLVEAKAIDIDQNGRVDILDAFKLARYIESGELTEEKWDFNGDGLVNNNDVDVVASAAVRLPAEKTRADVNKGV